MEFLPKNKWKPTNEQKHQIVDFIMEDLENLFGDSVTKCKKNAHWYEVFEFTRSIGADYKTMTKVYNVQI